MNSYDRIVRVHRLREDEYCIVYVLTESGRVFSHYLDVESMGDWSGWSELSDYPPGCDPNPHVTFK